MSTAMLNHDDLARGFESCEVPEYLREGIELYLTAHIPTGSFLLAVLANDLSSACDRADFDSRTHLWNVVFFLQNYAPVEAWGSRDKVRAWLDARPRRT